jgi:hypothetical protein
MHPIPPGIAISTDLFAGARTALTVQSDVLLISGPFALWAFSAPVAELVPSSTHDQYAWAGPPSVVGGVTQDGGVPAL